MNELFDLLPVPAERGLPSGRLEQRAAALVAAVEAEQSAAAGKTTRLRSWLTTIGLVLASVAAVCSILLAGNVRIDRTAAAETAVVIAGGSALVMVAAVPRPPRLTSPSTAT